MCKNVAFLAAEKKWKKRRRDSCGNVGADRKQSGYHQHRNRIPCPRENQHQLFQAITNCNSFAFHYCSRNWKVKTNFTHKILKILLKILFAHKGFVLIVDNIHWYIFVQIFSECVALKVTIYSMHGCGWALPPLIWPTSRREEEEGSNNWLPY